MEYVFKKAVDEKVLRRLRDGSAERVKAAAGKNCELWLPDDVMLVADGLTKTAREYFSLGRKEVAIVVNSEDPRTATLIYHGVLSAIAIHAGTLEWNRKVLREIPVTTAMQPC